MKKKMLGAFLPGNSTVEMREIDVPEPGIGEVLLKVKASGVCGSDIHYIYHGHKGEPEKGTAYLNVVCGHEPCGQVVGLGPGCKYFKEGDRVVVYHISGCGFCRNCRKGYQISCTSPNRKAYGWQRDGGNAEYMIAEEKDLIMLPEPLTWKDGCFISCGVGTAYEGILRAGVSGADTVLVVGLGPVGQAAAMLAKGMGARIVLGADVQEERIKTAKDLGFIDHIYKTGPDTLEQIRELTKGGATKTIDCSGNPNGRLLAIQATHEWGKTVFLGETKHVQFDVSDDLLHKQRTIIGSWVTSLYNMEECCDRLVEWEMHPDKIVTDVFPLSKAPEAFSLMANGGCGKVVIDPELD